MKSFGLLMVTGAFFASLLLSNMKAQTTKKTPMKAQTTKKTPNWPIPNQDFYEMEYFFDSSNKKIIIYFFEGSSALVYTGLVLHIIKMPQENLYNFCILSAVGKEVRLDPKFSQCADGGWMVSFDAPDFRVGRDILIYETSPGQGRRVINCLGGAKEAVARKLRNRQ